MSESVAPQKRAFANEASQQKPLNLVVIPSDPISAYEQAGYDWLERYFNPQKFFDSVYALSPHEQGVREAHGMTIRGVSRDDLPAVLRQLRPAVVRAYSGAQPAKLACEATPSDIPVVVSVHDTSPRLLRPEVRKADLLICVSKKLSQNG